MITPKKLYDEVIKVAEENHDTVGPNRYVGGTFVDPKPGCLLGTAMINLGVDVETLYSINFTLISNAQMEIFGKKYTRSRYLELLQKIQRKQDSIDFRNDDIHNYTWGEAIDV